MYKTKHQVALSWALILVNSPTTVIAVEFKRQNNQAILFSLISSLNNVAAHLLQVVTETLGGIPTHQNKGMTSASFLKSPGISRHGGNTNLRSGAIQIGTKPKLLTEGVGPWTVRIKSFGTQGPSVCKKNVHEPNSDDLRSLYLVQAHRCIFFLRKMPGKFFQFYHLELAWGTTC